MISIIIPAYNEEKRLGESLDTLSQYLKTFEERVEVIVVDDGSSDQTVQIAESKQGSFDNFRVIRLEHNLGKGAAVKKGFEEAEGEIVVFTDADFSTPITELPKLLAPIRSGFDIAVGSRALDRSLVKKHQNRIRELIGRLSNILIRALAVKGIYDTQCGFKAFRKDSCTKIFEGQTIPKFAFDVELLYLAQRAGLKIKEVGVLWFNNPASRVNPIRDTANSFFDLLRIRIRHAEKTSGPVDFFFYQVYRHQTYVRFFLVGLTSTTLDYSAYFVLTRFFHLAPLRANPFSVELAIIWSFTLNNLWTFSHRQNQRHILQRFLVFQFVTFGGLLNSQIQILVFIHFFNIPDLIAKLISIPISGLVNYTLNTRWTFRDVSHNLALAEIYPLIIVILLIVYLLLTKELTGNFSLFLSR